MSVYYRKDRDCWAVEVVDAFGRRSRKFLKSEAAARTLEAGLKRTISEQRAILARREIPNLKLSEAVQLFLSQQHTRPTTKQHYAHLMKHVTRALGDPPLDEITPQQLEEWQAVRRTQVAPSTCGAEGSLLHALFNWCLQEGHTTSNPARALYRKKRHSTESREITQDEIEKILQTPKSESVRLRLLLSLDAGLRHGEINILKRRHWDKEAKTITVFRPKTQTTTTIPLTPRLQAQLELVAAHYQPETPLVNRSGHQSHRAHQSVKNIALRSGVDFRLHELRHTFASRLRRVAPLEMVRHLLGHAPATVTERYVHFSLDDCRKAIEAMAAEDEARAKEARQTDRTTTQEEPPKAEAAAAPQETRKKRCFHCGGTGKCRCYICEQGTCVACLGTGTPIIR